MPFSDSLLSEVERLCRQHGGGVLDQEPLAETADPNGLTQSGSASTQDGDAAPALGGLCVSELLDIVNGAITRTFPSPIWVVGEVQNLNYRAQRGVFFNLAEQAQTEVSGSTLAISAVLWSDTLQRLEKRFGKDKISEFLQDGLALRVLCQVQFYRGRAQISLVVQDIDPEYTKGALALAREKLLKELRAKGLDLANKQRTLTAFPFKIGLITAENSRAASDFLHQLAQGAFCGEILFYQAAMQGERSPAEVRAGIQKLVAEQCDLIVLTRGGGSAADLRWFDTPEIAYAVAQCPIPIVAAVGHHDDRCVAEEICFHREKTPTAAADFILNCFIKTQQRIEHCIALCKLQLDQVYSHLFEKQNVLKERLKSAASDALVRKQESLLNLTHTLATQSRRQLALREQALATFQAGLAFQTNVKVTKFITQLAELQNKMQWQIALRLERLAVQNQHLEQTLHNADPRPWLQRGWTQLWQGQKQIQSIHDVAEGSVLWTRLIDGVMKVQVKEKIAKEETRHA